VSSSRPSTMDTLAYARRSCIVADRPAARLLWLVVDRLSGSEERVSRASSMSTTPSHFNRIGTLIWRIDGHSNPFGSWLSAMFRRTLSKVCSNPQAGMAVREFGEMSANPVLVLRALDLALDGYAIFSRRSLSISAGRW